MLRIWKTGKIKNSTDLRKKRVKIEIALPKYDDRKIVDKFDTEKDVKDIKGETFE